MLVYGESFSAKGAPYTSTGRSPMYIATGRFKR
jgi:hypothetical protein